MPINAMPADNKIQKLLIANRGEIALRIQRSARRLGIPSVITCSEADANGFVARGAEEIVVIGPAPVKESYLNQPALIAAAKKTGCNALHPGYGFLSENAEFAALVRAEGLLYVGPTAESIQLLGSKTAAREAALRANVPVVPGTLGNLSDDELLKEAARIGFPVIIKAVGGGGGRGMRTARSLIELSDALPRARAEALKNFGNGDVFLERLVIDPRHVEVQVFGDNFGTVLHFGTRDCSCQRRHQKVIEEAPAPFLAPMLRSAIEEAAVRVAQVVGYSNAGTAEFLVSGQDFFFLEMNTRIQVEHPVTEMVTGLDLVELQLRVTNNEPLGLDARHIVTRGHSIELRLYAEDPGKNFSPALGTIEQLVIPTYPWLRVERGFDAGEEVTPYYDAMLAKLIVTGESREIAVERAQRIAREVQVKGVATNLDLLSWILHFTAFTAETLAITTIERDISAATLDWGKSMRLRDPAFIAPRDGFEHRELVVFRDAEGTEREIAITHRDGGIFEVESREPEARRFRSTSRAAALQAVTE